MEREELEKRSHGHSVNIRNNLRKILQKGWIVALFRIIFSANALALGAFIAKYGLNEYSLTWLFVSIVFFGTFEFFFHKTIEYVREETRESTLASVQRIVIEDKKMLDNIEFQMSLFSTTSNFISSQLQRSIRTINEILKARKKGLGPNKELIMKKDRIIADTLKQMCHNFTTITSFKYRMPMCEVMFRATYMIIIMHKKDEEKLVYYAWHTPGGHPPKSRSEGIEYKKGEGVAGLAWKRERVVIEDKFKVDKEWRENYEGQGKLYKSMACIPVFDCTLNGNDNVIGVITIDTNVKAFFRKKDDKEMEERIANWIRPYGDNISFVTVMDRLISEELSEINSEHQ